MIEADFRCLFRKQRMRSKKRNGVIIMRLIIVSFFLSIHRLIYHPVVCLLSLSSLFIYCQSHPRNGQRVMETRDATNRVKNGESIPDSDGIRLRRNKEMRLEKEERAKRARKIRILIRNENQGEWNGWGTRGRQRVQREKEEETIANLNRTSRASFPSFSPSLIHLLQVFDQIPTHRIKPHLMSHFLSFLSLLPEITLTDPLSKSISFGFFLSFPLISLPFSIPSHLLPPLQFPD